MKPVDAFFRLLELAVVACMAAMVVMVFGNVVLRYGFNSGIVVSEELSRFCFIWLTYIGAMVAAREGAHLGVDTLVKWLPVGGRKACLFLSESGMLVCNALFFLGTWKMHALQASNVSAVAGLPMIWVYGVGYVVSAVIGAINLGVLLRLASGRIAEADLVQVVECEGLAEAKP